MRLLRRQPPEIRPIRGHQPEIVPTVAIRDEGNRGAVRRPPWHAVPRHPLRDARRLAAVDGNRVEIAQQIEDETTAVRRHVERDPRPLVSGEAQGAFRLQRKGVGRIGRHGRRFLRDARGRNEGKGQQARQGQSAQHGIILGGNDRVPYRRARRSARRPYRIDGAGTTGHDGQSIRFRSTPYSI